MSQKTAILGFGNPVRADDGIGIYVIERLKEKLGETDDISLFDMGTSAFEVLFKLKGHSKIILIDAVINSDEPVGTIFNLPASEVEEHIEEDPMVFLHGLKWNQALSYARKMLKDEYPQDIEVYLIAIESTKFNVGLTKAVIEGGDKMVDLLMKKNLSNKAKKIV